MWNPFRQHGLFAQFSTTALADGVKAAAVVIGGAAAPGVAFGVFGAEIAKNIAQLILGQRSQIELKLDRLLRAPLLTGLRHLNDGLSHRADSPSSVEARNRVLDEAHSALTEAWALVSDSREDSTFIRAIDCIALSARSGHEDLAARRVSETSADLAVLSERVVALEQEAADWRRGTAALRRFLDEDSLGSKPFGYTEQRMMARHLEWRAKRIVATADEARRRFDIISNIAKVATTLVDPSGQRTGAVSP